jgi:cytochrome c oxidase cbb3-type subunit III
MKLNCLLVAFACTRLLAQQALSSSPQDLARGQKLFNGRCASCHGPKGEGGRGALLARPALPHAPDDAELVKVIEKGIPGTEMPGAWDMIDKEIRWVAAYVRVLGQAPAEPVPGDAVRGRELYSSKGRCNSCHTVQGKGGGIGPDLVEVGLRRSPSRLRNVLIDPAADISEDYTPVRVTLRDGRSVDGVRINEDTFSIQVRDMAGRNHSYWKSELTDLRKEPAKSVMPAYRGAFTDAELDDLVAYLASLRGRS